MVACLAYLSFSLSLFLSPLPDPPPLLPLVSCPPAVSFHFPSSKAAAQFKHIFPLLPLMEHIVLAGLAGRGAQVEGRKGRSLAGRSEVTSPSLPAAPFPHLSFPLFSLAFSLLASITVFPSLSIFLFFFYPPYLSPYQSLLSLPFPFFKFRSFYLFPFRGCSFPFCSLCFFNYLVSFHSLSFPFLSSQCTLFLSIAFHLFPFLSFPSPSFIVLFLLSLHYLPFTNVI